MSRTKEELAQITQLGSQPPQVICDYDPKLLERFSNQHPENDYMVMLNCPDQYLVESKSLKLYLFSFRNHGDFHEDCCNIIRKDLTALLEPRYLEVTGIFVPRGGISIYPFANYAKPGSGYESYAKSRLFAAIDRREWK